jgi:hypothetical protein
MTMHKPNYCTSVLCQGYDDDLSRQQRKHRGKHQTNISYATSDLCFFATEKYQY